MDSLDLDLLHQRFQDRILARRNEQGYWEGKLSSSALSTATAVTALAVCDAKKYRVLIDQGIQWLNDNQNSDGGWGDTPRSLSNLSTTTLVWAAFGATDRALPDGAESWLEQHLGGPIEPNRVAQTIISSYGKDRTFSVPILTMCALAGRLGSGKDAWRHVIPLPFELAALPHRFYKVLNLPVVSYALPALIAIGQVHYIKAERFHPLRALIYRRCLRKLEDLQPTNGGFLEATPLTSFVLMSLAGAGQGSHRVAQKALNFLEASVRDDGSWPIDTHLATWVTTLAVNALPELDESEKTLAWLLKQQYRTTHPYTMAAPGGWAWTPLPGGVPDADDTPGALLAIHKLGGERTDVQAAAVAGIRWLLELQNRDGGFPTFCRGWGTLPFDKSCCDLTGHVLRAFKTWEPHLDLRLQKKINCAQTRAIAYLLKQQRTDGSWVPLWFGNEQAINKENPTLGTSRVLKALALYKVDDTVIEHGRNWLIKTQHESGGWGGDATVEPSVEETALATEVLPNGEARDRGFRFLADHIDDPPKPIGLYFAQLWYYEELYPLVFGLEALKTQTRKHNISST